MEDSLSIKLDVLIETLREMSHQNSTVETHVHYIKDAIDSIWIEIREMKDSRKKIYERLEKVEQATSAQIARCDSKHGIHGVHGPLTISPLEGKSFDEQAKAFIHSTLGQIVIWAAMLAIGALISKAV